jgi:hypothetical protein
MERVDEEEDCWSLDELFAGSCILDNILSYLDIPSLKQCRLVNRNWGEVALGFLMEQTYFVVSTVVQDEKEDKVHSRINEAGLYSSWKLEYNLSKEIHPELLLEFGECVQSLYISGLPLDNPSIIWTRTLLSSWCPNVVELRLSFHDPIILSDTLYEELAEYQRSLDDTTFLGGFQKILQSNPEHNFQPFNQLPNVQSLILGPDLDKVGSHVGFNLIVSCPNLRHLFLLQPQVNLRTRDLKANPLRILEYLSRAPAITRKLETFQWEFGKGHGKGGAGFLQSQLLYNEQERQPLRMLARTGKAPMQFSAKLKNLHWDVCYVDSEGNKSFLPGILDKVAGNLRKFSTRRAVLDPADFPPLPSGRLNLEPNLETFQRLKIFHNIKFPVMRKLSVIEIGMRTCYTISLRDLVDAAPNLRTLEIMGCECCDILKDSVLYPGEKVKKVKANAPADNIWGSSDSPVPIGQQHVKLKILKAGISLRNDGILQKVIRKFPNLEELWIGRGGERNRTMLKLQSTFAILEELSSLQRLYWTYAGGVDLSMIIENLTDSARVKSLRSYHLEILRPWSKIQHIELQSYVEGKKELLGNLCETVKKDSPCKRTVSWNRNLILSELDLEGDEECKIESHSGWNCHETIREFLKYIHQKEIPIYFQEISCDNKM